MPEVEWNSSKQLWLKQCIGPCNKLFEVGDVTHAEAVKALSEYFSASRPEWGDGLNSYCRTCETNRKNGRVYNGVSREELLSSQSNKCAICYKEISFKNNTARIDHDHKTGTIRGVLCQRCNIRMNAVDDNDWLCVAIEYRDLHRED